VAVTQTHINNQIVKWRTRVMREWRRGNLFSAYMGEGPNEVIQVTNELKQGGDILSIPIVGALRGPGVSTGPLTGNEEKLDNYGMRLWVDWSRNAVLLTKAQMRKSAFEQLELVRPLLTEWGNSLLRDEIVQAMMAIPTEAPPVNLGNEATSGQRVNGILWEQSSAAQKNQWLTDNADRVLFGAAKSNLVAGNFTSSALNLDAPTDNATAKLLLLAKRIARSASPGLSPYKDSEDLGREYFVVFAGAEPFRDLAADPAIIDANTNARPRENGGMDRNPLFQDGDLLYRGIIVREIPEISDFYTLVGAGTGGTNNVQPMFMCGQNAVALGWGQAPKPTERNEDDYGFLIGRGVESVYGVGKVFKKRDPESSTVNLIQWGMVTIFVAAQPDA
jgi:hypothetical protein